MKVVRDTNFKFRGVMSDHTGTKYLMFEDVNYPDYLVLVRRAKYVKVKSNVVEYLDADSYSEGFQTPTTVSL